MKKITLTKGQVAIVDDESFKDLSKFKWHAIPSGKTFYAQRRGRKPEQAFVRMHREVLKLSCSKERAFHIDGNGLNNQGSNLKVISKKSLNLK